jgi:ATP-dependent DNA helicase RecQ
MAEALREELYRWFGHRDFRDGQREIVEAVLAGSDTLAILPTGGGKSLTYQFPALLLPGVTLVLSPLIALMKDQVENLPAAVAERATLINSTLELAEMGRRLRLVRTGAIKLVYAAPERLRQASFLHTLRQAGVSLVVVDEAHCISQWGHDFRPDYRAVGKAIEQLAPKTVLAVTATATPDVADDIEAQIGRPLHRITHATFRKNLNLAAVAVRGEDEKLRTTLQIARQTEGYGLIYAGSREKCEQLSRMLTRYGVEAGFYHAGLPPEERAAAQDRFMSGNIRVMVATVAFGMGVDKSDIRFLVHFHPSRSLENYYQEAGRAGRDGELSQCILLHSSADRANARRRLREEVLTRDGVKQVYQAVRGALSAQGRRIAPVAWDTLSQAVGEDTLIRATLPLLEEVGLIARHGDLPKRLSLYPCYEDDIRLGKAEIQPEWLQLAEAIGTGGDFDPVRLSDMVGIPLPELEETVLRCAEVGLLTTRFAPRDMLFELLPASPETNVRLNRVLTEREAGAVRRMEAMLAYASEERCRHQQIARYFGDRWARLSCGACDICESQSLGSRLKQWLGQKMETNRGGSEVSSDAVENPPRLVLRAVYDLTQSQYPFAVGKSGLVKILRGTPDAPVKPQRTVSFGKLEVLPRREVERIVDALTEKGYLERDDSDEYRRLYLTAEGKAAARSGEIDVDWRRTGQPRVEIDPNEANPAVLEALKEWRQEVADAENLPPFYILAEKTVIGLAVKCPANEFELQEVPGIGPAKAAKFGEDILEIVRKHRP